MMLFVRHFPTLKKIVLHFSLFQDFWSTSNSKCRTKYEFRTSRSTYSSPSWGWQFVWESSNGSINKLPENPSSMACTIFVFQLLFVIKQDTILNHMDFRYLYWISKIHKSVYCAGLGHTKERLHLKELPSRPVGLIFHGLDALSLS